MVVYDGLSTPGEQIDKGKEKIKSIKDAMDKLNELMKGFSEKNKIPYLTKKYCD